MEIDFIKEIQETEPEIKEEKLPNNIALLKQTFILWYLLIEGSNEIEEDELQQTLNRNIILINKFYPNNSELLFLKGWMINISFWYFNLESDEIGNKYLRLAYKNNPDNLLFKWALPQEQHETKATIERLEAIVLENLHQYYIDYTPIQEYFKNVVGRR